MKNLAIFASGSGSNCENIIRYFQGHEHIAVTLVLCNKADAFVLERARRLGVPSCVVPSSATCEPASPYWRLPFEKRT